MNVLVVGLTPDYYSSPVSTAVTAHRAAMRSTNMGASFITRSIVSMFNAEYIDFMLDVDISELQNKYDVCVVSLASHLGPSRDVSKLVGFLKQLDLKTVFLSGGLDAGATGAQKIHKSLIDLLDLCSADNQWIGVRGAASALYLHRQGFNNVVPVGCPTMYSRFSSEIQTPRIEGATDIAVPFHWKIAANLINELSDHFLIGQDSIDEELFLGGNGQRITNNIHRNIGGSKREIREKLRAAISKNSYFPEKYDKWYEALGAQTALLSGRLHGAICGLTQGVPTVLVPWDIRSREIVDYFCMPVTSSDTISNDGARSAVLNADFDKYNERRAVCWARWSEFVQTNGLEFPMQESNKTQSSTRGYAELLWNDKELLGTASLLRDREDDRYPLSFRRILRNFKRNAVSYYK
ncbi:polysaccharide pyruvyl transferase [Spiribacter vilamensis]|uniref:Polysaccharide pyruvyl transferase n=2 Tax=Spiribacter vilamensis TaxID=531306 RepID=A0A4V2GJB2_9GAMM|nr:polysaccharide pyruvyl transferase [Spiribacter vilamensis]